MSGLHFAVPHYIGLRQLLNLMLMTILQHLRLFTQTRQKVLTAPNPKNLISFNCSDKLMGATLNSSCKQRAERAAEMFNQSNKIGTNKQ